MCWIGTSSAKIAEKDIVVYKIGKVLNNKFRSLYQNYIYGVKELNAKISLRPASDWDYLPHSLIWEGYHSYLTEETAKYVRDMWNTPEEIGIFEVPVGATIYVNYKLREVVSTDIKYLGVLEL